MKQFGKFLAGICAALFVISGVIAIFVFNIERKTFTSETYKQAFKEQGVYQTAPSVFAEMIISSTEDPNGISPITSLLSRENLTFLISSLLPPDELEQLLNAAFDSFFAYLNGDTDTISIPLLSIKQYAASGTAAQSLTQIIRVQPECTADQLWQMSLNLLSPDPVLILCNPPEHLTNLVLPFFQTQLVTATSSLPDELIIAGDSQPGLIEFRTRLTRVRDAMRIVPVIPVVFLLGIVIFGVRKLHDWLMWWGIPFIVTGTVSALVALIGSPIVRLFLETFILRNASDTPVIFLNMMHNVAGALVNQILSPVIIAGVILAIIGAGMVVSAKVFANKRQAPFSTN